MLRYLSAALVALTVLGAGCEQIKALRKLPELEGKVDDLGNQVATLSGSGSGAGSGSAKDDKAAKAESKSDGKTESKPDDKAAKSDDKPDKADKPDDKVAKADDKSDAKSEDKPAKPDDKADDKADPKSDDKAKATKSDPALARLLAVVAENTGKGKPVAPWSYDGKTGPAAWSSLDPGWQACGGQAQSPIDIEPRAGNVAPIEFTYKPTPATVIDTGHSLQVNLGPGSEIEIGDTVYQLVQIHFHTPSEHTIAGEHYPLEVQLVHQDATGKLAIIAVLYDTGLESKTLGQLWSAWPHKLGAPAKLAQPIDPSLLLPETRTVFRYTGSLTTPPCSEGVLWNVMRRTLCDSKSHLAAFALHYPHNAREVQPLGDRKIE